MVKSNVLFFPVIYSASFLYPNVLNLKNHIEKIVKISMSISV